MSRDEAPKTYTRSRLEPRQICPAPAGTRAMYRDEDGTGFTRPLIGIALCESWEETLYQGGRVISTDEKMCVVRGVLAGELLEVDDAGNLERYLSPTDSLEEACKDLKLKFVAEPPDLETRKVLALESIAASLEKLTKAAIRTSQTNKPYVAIDVSGSVEAYGD